MIKNISICKNVYFDNAATSPLSDTANKIVQEAIVKDWCWCNPSSIYGLGRKAKKKLEEAREIIARCIGAEPEEVYFNSGSSESISFLVKGVLDSPGCTGNSVLMSPTEHPAMVRAAEYMKSTGHFEIDYCEVDEGGSVDVELFERYLSDYRVQGGLHGLCSVIHCGNEIGNVNPIIELARLSHSYGVPLISDTTQSIGKIKVDVKDLGIDYCFASGSKLGALRQSGFIYISNDASVKPIPLIHGSQEKSLRGGTESVLSAWVLAKCLEEHVGALERSQRHVQGLKKYLIAKLNQSGICFELNGDPLGENQSGIGIVNFSLPYMKMDGESLQLMLGSSLPGYEIPCYVSTGSACSSGSSLASHVLMALPGMILEKAARSIRVSFGADNTVDEIDYFVEKMRYVLEVFG